MTRNLCLIGLAATLVLGLVPAAVHAETITYDFRGEAAYAQFETTEGCIGTATEIYVYEFQVHDPPGPAPEGSPAIQVFVRRHDRCLSIFLGQVSAFADLPEGAFSLQGGLQAATLNATIEVEDELTGDKLPLSIDIVWSGVGEVSRSNVHEHSSSPGLRSMWRSKGARRDATAAGSVLLEAVNVTPDPSIYGFLMDAQTGNVIIERF